MTRKEDFNVILARYGSGRLLSPLRVEIELTQPTGKIRWRRTNSLLSIKKSGIFSTQQSSAIRPTGGLQPLEVGRQR